MNASSLLTDYLHVLLRLLLRGVAAAAFASLLGVAVDLAFVAGLGGQRVIVHLASLPGPGVSPGEAQTRDAVPETKTKADGSTGDVLEVKGCFFFFRAFLLLRSRTLVPHGSTPRDTRTGSPRPCWSSRTCRGCGWWSTR